MSDRDAVVVGYKSQGEGVIVKLTQERAVNYDELPDPDEWGNLYLGGTGDVHWMRQQRAANNGRSPKRLPAIFQVWGKKNPAAGEYYPVPLDEDVPFADGRILTFPTPELALEWLRRMAARKGGR